MRDFLIYSTALVIVDQLTKYLMQGKSFFTGWFSLNYVTNTGAAFGIMTGWRWFFVVVGILVIGLIFYYYRKYKYQTGLIFLLAGTLGNLIDRIFLGFVRDFISVKYFSTFNIADVFSVVGVMLIIYYTYKARDFS